MVDHWLLRAIGNPLHLCQHARSISGRDALGRATVGWNSKKKWEEKVK
jgi:hypothetical protein